MKTKSKISSLVFDSDPDSKIILVRLVVGLIFISEGILKYRVMEWLGPGRFAEIGFSHAFFWAYFTGAFEIVCGILVLLGFMTRPASVPLLVIMAVAFITTKLPLIATKGFWSFAHEYDTDFALTLLLIFLLIYGGGKWSLDQKLFSPKKL